jgi:acyl-CoA synthetase (AMP-forming)/AMP-acid ligase II
MFVLEQIEAFAGTDRIALINREERLTFSALHARSEAFAAWLLGQGGSVRAPVVIYGHKETDFLPCVFGALKAGRAYVPVDVSMPVERVNDIVADVQPDVIVDFTGRLAGCAQALDTRSLRAILLAPPAHAPKAHGCRGMIPPTSSLLPAARESQKAFPSQPPT